MKEHCDWLFPTPVMVTEFTEKELDNEYYTRLILNKSPVDILHRDGHITSSDDLFKFDDYKDMVSLIDTQVEKYCNNVLKIDKQDLKMSAMWLNVHMYKSYHQLHMHANSFLSGVLYINIPKNCESSKTGYLGFLDPRPVRNFVIADNYDMDSVEVAGSWKYKPIDRMLILFPSWLPHSVREIDVGNEYRISISFNYMLTKSSLQTMSFNYKDFQ